MIKTSQPAEKTIQHNPIHIDSQWFKTLVPITGSVEAALILADCMIYHHNQYRSFTINDQQQYGLLTSVREIQRQYHISYKRAKLVLDSLLDQNLLEKQPQGFVHNQKFYTPTDKALDMIQSLQSRRKNTGREDDSREQPLLPIGQSTFPYRQKTYKDKDKKHNTPNTLLKNYSLLKNLKSKNVKTVTFDFKRFHLGNIQREAPILDDCTAKQSEVINTITFCNSSTLDIVKFNHMLNRTDLKKEAKDFRQLVSWAYLEAVHDNDTVMKNKAAKITDVSVEKQDNTTSLSADPSLDMSSNGLKEKALPDMTSTDIQAMINEKTQQPASVQTSLPSRLDTNQQENERVLKLEDISDDKTVTTASDSSYLLSPTNQLCLIESLSAKGIEDAHVIITTAEEIIQEYAHLGFNELLDGVIYRLVTPPEKQKRQNETDSSLLFDLSDMDRSEALESIAKQSQSEQINAAALPQLSDLTMPHADTDVLRQDWASKAEQDFYTGILPDLQQLALLAIMDYVKRKGVTITVEQEVYEWLYHMASNQKYYYSKASNFKHRCNIVMRHLMQRRLHKPAGFDGWRSRILGDSFAVAA